MRKVNISIDDVTPHPRSSIAVVRQCERILAKVPTAKFTLFVPTAYWRSVPTPPESLCQSPYLLRNFPEFCGQLRNLAPDSYEIGFHGHFHGIPGRSNNDELRSLSEDQATDLFQTMMAEVSEAGLLDVFKPILRPPAWRMSPGAFDAAQGKFEILALHPSETYTSIYGGKQNESFWQNRIVYQDASPPNESIPDSWDTLEIVMHACEWDRNFLSDSQADMLISLFESSGAVGAFIGDLRGQV